MGNTYSERCYFSAQKCNEEIERIPCEDCQEVWRRAECWMAHYREAHIEVTKHSASWSQSDRVEITNSMQFLKTALNDYFDRYNCDRPSL